MTRQLQPSIGFCIMSAGPISRRGALRLAGLSLAGVCLSRPESAYALKPGKPSKERLLRKLQDEKTPEETEEEKSRIAEERRQRLEKQRELQAAADRRKSGEDEAENVDDIESNLRGQYYFPTARKRYLPRVRLAWETIPMVEQATKDEKWPDVSSFSSQELSDAVLPMKLYTSSLAGGGLNINAKFIERMNSQTDAYEKALAGLLKAVKKKQTSVALDQLITMRDAINKYREFGRLDGDDFGIGEIPKDTRVGSGFGNNNSALYRRNRSVQETSSQ